MNSIEVFIQNEKQLIENLNNELIDSLIINISDINIEIFDNLEINNELKSLTFQGVSKELSILELNDISNNIIFNYNVKEININNITIKGQIIINNENNVVFNNTILYGGLDTFSGRINGENILMNDFTFYSLSSKKSNCINMYGNAKIDNSFFYGSSSCTDRILYYDGENINDINISNSYFNGMYINGCLKITNAIKSNIINSFFEKGAAYKLGG